MEALAYHGLDLQVHIRTDACPAPFTIRLTADAADRRPPRVGESVEAGWSAADTRIFPE
ncbi:TOBE domain-containing protein [Klebsiella pneumoniae]|uniref:TOBE domain-containing protein n=1 Tax=Klebsiella pneumoniae TaxID=573 RepID=UPI0034D5C392